MSLSFYRWNFEVQEYSTACRSSLLWHSAGCKAGRSNRLVLTNKLRDIWKEITVAFFFLFFFREMCARTCVSFSQSRFLRYPCACRRSALRRFSNPPLMSVPSQPAPISRQHQSSPCDLHAYSSGALTSSITPLVLISVRSACHRRSYYILKFRGLLLYSSCYFIQGYKHSFPLAWM